MRITAVAVLASLASGSWLAAPAFADGLSCAELYQQMKEDYNASPDAKTLASWESRIQANLPAYDDIAKALNELYLSDMTDYDRRLLVSYLNGDYSDFNALLHRFFESPRIDKLQKFADPECQAGDRHREVLSSQLTGKAVGATVEQARGTETYLLFCQRLRKGQDPQIDASWEGAQPKRFSSLEVKTEAVLEMRSDLYKRIQGRSSLIPPDERERELRDAALKLVEYIDSPLSEGPNPEAPPRRVSSATVMFSLLDLVRLKKPVLVGRDLAERKDPRPSVESFEQRWAKQRPNRCPLNPAAKP